MSFYETEEEPKAPPRVRSIGRKMPGYHNPGSYGAETTIAGMNESEQQAVEAMLLGECWIRITDSGRLVRRSRFEPLPDPEPDPQMVPHWSGETKLVPYQFDDVSKHSSPAIFIQHLCGYGYTPDAYRREAAKLERFGFECMRSRRGPEGRQWEVWYLPGLWSAKDELADAIKGAESKTADRDRQIILKAATDFLCSRCSFGTLDVVVQRAAMVID